MDNQISSNSSTESCGNSNNNTVDYTDYANEVESAEPNPPVDSTEDVSTSTNGATMNSEQNFPVKLHYLLGDMEKDGLDNIVSWQTHGRSFTVHKPKEFAKLILPLWFRQSKFSSFQRQLNLYSFKRISTGPDKGSYYHENFLRGKRFLCFRIKRLKIKGTRYRKPSTPGNEPNFYLMPFLSPTKVGGSAADSGGGGGGGVANAARAAPMNDKKTNVKKGSQGKRIPKNSNNSSGEIPSKANSPLLASIHHVPNLASMTAPSAASLALLADLRRQQQQQQLLSQLSLFPNSLSGLMFTRPLPQTQMYPAISLAAAWLNRGQLQQQQQPSVYSGAVGDLTSAGALEAASLILAMRRRQQQEQDQVVENLLLAHHQQQQQQQQQAQHRL